MISLPFFPKRTSAGPASVESSVPRPGVADCATAGADGRPVVAAVVLGHCTEDGASVDVGDEHRGVVVDPTVVLENPSTRGHRRKHAEVVGSNPAGDSVGKEQEARGRLQARVADAKRSNGSPENSRRKDEGHGGLLAPEVDIADAAGLNLPAVDQAKRRRCAPRPAKPTMDPLHQVADPGVERHGRQLIQREESDPLRLRSVAERVDDPQEGPAARVLADDGSVSVGVLPRLGHRQVRRTDAMGSFGWGGLRVLRFTMPTPIVSLFPPSVL